MDYAFVGRISRTYEELADLFDGWAKQSRYLWVYEHSADEKVNRTHCHFFISGSRADREKLKERKSWKDFNAKGNEFSAMKTYDPTKEYKYITYMTKGVLDYKLAYGDNADVIANECKAEWVDNTKCQFVDANVNANANANVNVKKKSSERVHWDIIEEVRQQIPYVEVLRSDQDGTMVSTKRIADFDITYNVLMKVLDKYKIRTANYEINRWLTTIFRDDPYWGHGIKENFRKMFSPVNV